MVKITMNVVGQIQSMDHSISEKIIELLRANLEIDNLPRIIRKNGSPKDLKKAIDLELSIKVERLKKSLN